MSRFALRAAVAGLCVAALGVAACGTDHRDSGKPQVVASTNVWGSVAQAVAGPDADVASIISDPAADPHSFESAPADAARVTDADLVVYNGGGYDSFIDKILAAEPAKRTVQAYELRADKNDDNEHVWYDIPTVTAVTAKIATELGDVDPTHRQGYADRAKDFDNRLREVSAAIQRIAAGAPHAPVAQTEPIAHYLLLAAGVVDLTPHGFEHAIEDGTDPSPSDVAATRDLLTGRKVRALVYNSQTEDKLTKDIRTTAQAADIPVVAMTETLPAGVDYLEWQLRNAESLSVALHSEAQ
ncbi:ABC transporter permease [Skermania sp. ID1734]|uniref:metal ABC transporter solute-binding protein, Zn/Mn family n=1 Tax=Skermania sp. ID1734 TaxID=2597516 RepID=UPI00117FDDAB|nr:zinc ABC transporter substrate-binding protein [Skermania sp. ID1734]TSD95634.1 ABC transporter permease [Skermania sp. ID1734]